MALIPTTAIPIDGGNEMEAVGAFDMGCLGTHLPKKRRGLSTCFSGKSRSFACLGDVRCVDDLGKPEIPEAKRRKYSCRAKTSTPIMPFCGPFLGV